jgi:hypothetical protein
MARFFHPLIMVLARATESELARYVEYLKAENRVFRDKLPKRVVCTPAERQRLVKLGKPPDPVVCLGPRDVVCRERLGGLPRHYERRVA